MSDLQNRNPPEGATAAVDGYVVTTVPVRVEVDVRKAVLNLEEAEKVLRLAGSIALGPCSCRKTEAKCDAPVETCLSLNQGEKGGETEGFRPVSVEEALAALRVSHEAGLVHLAYRRPGKEITEFCSCCSCCCWFLNKLKAFEYHDALIESTHIAHQDVERCIGCGTCVERCHFDAWNLPQNGDKPSLNMQRCFGCGVCVSHCPAEAISLIQRPASLR